MADITLTSACVLKHRQLITCRRAELGAKIVDKISIGENADCLKRKMRLVDAALSSICSFDADATLNCLTDCDVCKIINFCYKLLPEDC